MVFLLVVKSYWCREFAGPGFGLPSVQLLRKTLELTFCFVENSSSFNVCQAVTLFWGRDIPCTLVGE